MIDDSGSENAFTIGAVNADTPANPPRNIATHTKKPESRHHTGMDARSPATGLRVNHATPRNTTRALTQYADNWPTSGLARYPSPRDQVTRGEPAAPGARRMTPNRRGA